jgi:hypothetical protein
VPGWLLSSVMLLCCVRGGLRMLRMLRRLPGVLCGLLMY